MFRCVCSNCTHSKTYCKEVPFMRRHLLFAIFFLVISPLLIRVVQSHPAYAAANSANDAFEQAAKEFAVPSSLLKALCYLEGRLSNHSGSASIDGGYGCMHLTRNTRGDTLGRAAKELGVSDQQLELDMSANIRGGAIILRDDAIQ